MLHFVLPPNPPPILKTTQPVNLAAVIGETDSKTRANNENSQQQSEAPPQATSSSATENSPRPSAAKPTGDKLSSAQTLSTPSTPQTFPAGFSPLTDANSAVFLGEPISVGYPMQQGEISHPNNGNSSPDVLTKALPNQEQVAQTLTNSQKLSQSQSQPVAEKLVPAQKSNASGENSENTNTSQSTPQPIKIQFNTQAQTNKSPQPSTIEFKSRNFTAKQQSAPVQPGTTPTQPTQPTQPPATPPQTKRVVEVIADRQEYDEARRVVTAEGNVVVRFDGAVVDADRLQVNLDNLIAVGEGNVALTRGDQVLRGQRFTYNFIQDNGELFAGSGEIFIPTAGQDLSFAPTTDPAATGGGVPAQPLSDRIRRNQPLTGVGSPGGIDFDLGGRSGAINLPQPPQGGQVRRLRFEAARVTFYPRGWQARDVRITNDPFSPPELELRADQVTLTRESPLRDRITTDGQRLVFDQGLTLGIPKDQQVIDRSERQVTPALVSFGFDGDQRGGVFLERSFQPIDTQQVRWSVTPQFYAQKTVQEGADNIPSLFGLKTNLNATLSPRAVVEGSGVLTSFDLSDVEDNLRASLRLRQQVGDIRNPHTLALEYSYRDRLYNGTLGFQTVQSSLGGVVSSPVIPLGQSGLNLRYQAGAQYITANSDRQDLLEEIRDNDRVSLGRFQASAAVDGGVTLWQGKPLPPTATEGLRYTANPVVPYLRAFGEVRGTSSYYTNGDNQSTLTGTIGLEGQIGNFSRPFLDYTGFLVSYSQGLNSGESPFLFDRAVDNRVLRAGITQQIYGPFRFGFQTTVNLDTGERSSTDYVLEYSRRTYGITLRYNPILELGGISFRISDFNWTGGTDPFSDPREVKPVVDGVEQR